MTFVASTTNELKTCIYDLYFLKLSDTLIMWWFTKWSVFACKWKNVCIDKTTYYVMVYPLFFSVPAFFMSYVMEALYEAE